MIERRINEQLNEVTGGTRVGIPCEGVAYHARWKEASEYKGCIGPEITYNEARKHLNEDVILCNQGYRYIKAKLRDVDDDFLDGKRYWVDFISGSGYYYNHFAYEYETKLYKYIDGTLDLKAPKLN